MADEDLASVEEAEALELAPETEENQPADDPIASLASEMGWTPKDQWRGDPDKWRPAGEFIKAGRDIQQTTSRELKAVREQLDRIGGVTTRLIEDKVSERDDYWRQKRAEAVEEGDLAAVDRADAERQKLRQSAPTQGSPAEVQEWVSRNEWFNKDPLAQVRAKEISDKLAANGISDVGTQLREVERAIRKEFPEHFAAKAKDPPATQTGASRKAAPSNRVKGFNDMPPESQQVARDFERLNGLSKDDFAKQYWVNQAKKGTVG